MTLRSLFLALAVVVIPVPSSGSESQPAPTFEEFLEASAVPREVIDRFLQGPAWARYDPELGYVLGSDMPADGIDGSATISTVQPNGARTSFVYVGKPCRINTYGDSFTQCHQVSDGETWQEYLAGHLGEPIRNVGMGGCGVYQVYRRLIRDLERGPTEKLAASLGYSMDWSREAGVSRARLLAFSSRGRLATWLTVR